MKSTRTLGEAIEAISAGNYVKVKGVGILLLTNKPRRGRKPKEEKAK